MLELYTRTVDAGYDDEMVLAKDGVVVAQWLQVSDQEHQPGSENPNLVGQPLATLQDKGLSFIKIEKIEGVSGHQEFNIFLNELYAEKVLGQSL